MVEVGLDRGKLGVCDGSIALEILLGRFVVGSYASSLSEGLGRLSPVCKAGLFPDVLEKVGVEVLAYSVSLGAIKSSGNPFGFPGTFIAAGFRLDILRRASMRFLFCLPYLSLTISVCFAGAVA